MMKKLQIFYKNRSSTYETPTTIGSYVIVKNKNDNIFYRCKIFDYNEKLQKYKIHFIDIGNKSICTLNDIFDVEKQFTKLPIMAIRCGLPNVIVNCEQNDVVKCIDKYQLENNNILCEFQITNNDITFVELFIDGNKLTNLLINDGIITSLNEGTMIDDNNLFV